MSTPTLKSAFSAGELSPSLYGRLELAKWHAGCSVARNTLVKFQGGQISRGGTALVGACKQVASGSSFPPRNIEFTFNIFQSYTLEFGDFYMRVIANGGYVLEASKAITAATRANPCLLTSNAHGFVNDDWVFVDNVLGMTALNRRTFIVANATANTFTLKDVFGDPVDSTIYEAYVSGGTVSRLFTLVTPYAAKDLPYLKVTQSADVMSLCLINQQTQIDYQPQELARLAANNWTLTPPTFASSIAAPASCTATPTVTWPPSPVPSPNPGPAAYGYVVTAVADDGQESIASPVGTANTSVAIAEQFGSITVSWSAVTGAVSYNIYRAAPQYFATAPTTADFSNQLFGFAGSTKGALTWQDANIIPDFAITPPLHLNPFSGSGNYPGVVDYFQQRRVYAMTLNDPDTYQMSRPGSFLNFDAADPPIDSDAITGSPWAKQVNGIQWLLPMPGGLITATGKDAWQVAGTAGAGSPITPAQQSAQQQESIGFSPILQPLKIGPYILYGQALGSAVRELSYQFYSNIYTGKDITVLSQHLFQGRQIVQWAWQQEPYKILWGVRDDGKMLALTYVKDEEVAGWTRADTNGLIASVSTASEPPVNAVYLIVKRYIRGKGKWLYCQERMNSRLWSSIEDTWAVDSALALAQPTPNATASASRASPTNAAKPGNIIVGGANYSASVGGRIEDPTGTGAVVNAVTVVAGVITGYTISPAGSGYSAPVIVFSDATGSGAIAEVLLDKSTIITTDADVFSSGDVGSVVRMGGGIAVVTVFGGPRQVTADLIKPIALTLPNDPNAMPIPAAPGQWTLTRPVASIGGLEHLEGMTVTGLADGKVIPPTQVASGLITLSEPASAIVVGLPFTAQLQSMHADMPGEMIQGKRKRVQGVTVRLANSRGARIGQDQPIAATKEYQAEQLWDVAPNFMTAIDDAASAADAGNAVPLFTGDKYVSIAGDYHTTDGQPSPGMVAVLQDQPLPLEVLAFIPLLELGDVPNG